MASNRTRTFKGVYTSHDNRKHNFNMRVSKRLVTFGLEISLIKDDNIYCVLGSGVVGTEK